MQGSGEFSRHFCIAPFVLVVLVQLLARVYPRVSGVVFAGSGVRSLVPCEGSLSDHVHLPHPHRTGHQRYLEKREQRKAGKWEYGR